MTRPRPRPDLADLTPYKTSDVATGSMWLHANENPYAPPPEIVDEIHELAREHPLNRYPASADELKKEIASYAGVDPSWIWLGDGSNEVLLQACLAFGGPGRKALLFEPTYVMHRRQARMAGTDVVVTQRGEDFAIDPYSAVEAIDATSPDIVFICTPNNPTGTVTPQADLKRLVDASPGLVVIDEAYYEFSKETFVNDLAAYPNVIVARTLSKAFRLASVRMGYGIAHPDLLTELARVRMPYAQSAFTQAAALVALRRKADLLNAVPKIIAERERMSDGLDRAGATVFESGANFVLFRHPRPSDLLKALAERGIVIRDFRQLEGCEMCLRVTAGTSDENDAFLEVVKAVG